MPFLNYFGMGAALAVVGFVIAFSNVPIDRPAPEAGPIPIATLEAVGSTSPFKEQLEALIPSPEILPSVTGALGATATTSAPVPSITPAMPPARPTPQAPIKVPAAPTTMPAPVVVAPLPAPEPSPETPESTALAKARAASVNILCTASGSVVHGMSGSGIIIDPRGIIMTVAHVGQYYLLSDYPSLGTISCTVRTGSPAHAAYTARPIYISERWIARNPSTLVTQAPKGSGEDDFAFLAITGSATGTPLPSSFSYAPLAKVDPKKGETVVMAAYPAQTLTTAQIQSALPLTSATSTVRDRYTFNTTSIDVVSLAGNTAAQTGSSGGGVLNLTGQVLGLITTSSTEGPYASRTLHAITPGHIRRSFNAETGDSLDSFLSKNSIADLLSSFLPFASALRSDLVRGISG